MTHPRPMGDRRTDTYHPITWQEQAESDERTRGLRLPPWHELEAEAVRTRATFCTSDEARARFAALYAPGAHARVLDGTMYDAAADTRGAPFGDTTGHARLVPPAESFTPTNVQHFQFLPTIEALKRIAVAEGLRMASQAISPAMMLAAQHIFGKSDPLLLDATQQERIGATIRAEQAHLLYHKAMWRAHGRRVLVLDPTTYTLLANSDLPHLPASLLAAPWASFYIQLPPRAFEFEVQDVRHGTVDRRFVEGIAVAIDHPEPGFAGLREIAYCVMGEEEGMGSEGRNCAFTTMRFTPTASLSTFDADKPTTYSDDTEHGRRQNAAGLGYGLTTYVGARELNVVVPRLIVGLLLYLASEHPDVMPVPPAPRRTFSDIRSPKQRAAALAREVGRLKHATRLPVLVIGAHLRAELDAATAARQADDERAGKRWTLDHAVLVRGHYRRQAYGPGRAERRMVWIRPFLRGPDAAESMAIKAARVPRGQLNPESKV